MVAMNVWPTDGADGSVSSEARWRKMGRVWTPSGVAGGVGAELQPTLAFPNLTIKAGAAWVDGHYCELLGDQVLAVTANGLVVVRFDPAANTAQLLYLDAVSVPSQSPTGIWELPIARITGSALVDYRGPRIGASLPLGRVASLTVNANTAPATALADTGYQLNWVVQAGRRYHAWLHSLMQGTVANDLGTVFLTDASNNRLVETDVPMVGSLLAPVSIHVELANLPAGQFTLKTRLQRSVGTGSVTLLASPTNLGTICVEDIGAV